MHAKHIEFCMRMWQKGVMYEACLECGYLDQDGEEGIASPEVLSAVASGLLDIGFELAHVKALLKPKTIKAYTIELRQFGKPESEREHLPEITEQELRSGYWFPTGCVTMHDIREAVRSRFPDDASAT